MYEVVRENFDLSYASPAATVVRIFASRAEADAFAEKAERAMLDPRTIRYYVRSRE